MTAVLHQGLDLFANRAIQTQIKDQRNLEIFPINPIAGSEWFEFVVPADPMALTDLARTEIDMFCKLTYLKPNATEGQPPVPTAAKMAPINLFSATIFDQVEVSLGNKNVCDKSALYAYRAYLQTLLSYDSDAKANHLQVEGYYPDTAGKFDTISDENNGHKLRQLKFTKIGSLIHVIGRVHTDITQQPNLLIPNIEIRFRFHMAPQAFILMGDAADADHHRFTIEDIKLNIRRVYLYPEVEAGLINALAVEHAKYPITKVKLTSFNLSRNTSMHTINHVHTGKLPKRLIVGFMDDSAMRGSTILNPFNFQHFDIKRFAVFIDSTEIAQSPLTFKHKSFTQAYLELCKTVAGEEYPIKDIGISLDDYAKGGYNLYAFDLTPDNCSDSHYSAERTGNIRFELEIPPVADKTIRMLCFFELNGLVEITKHRDVIVLG